MSNTPAIRIENLSKFYRIYEKPADRLKQMLFRGRRMFFREHRALKTISLEIPRGQTVGIVGANGSGKSTLLQMIAGTLTPTTGKVEVAGRLSALLELGAGFNPEFSGDDNIALSARILGLGESEVKEKYAGIIEFSGLAPEHLRQPVKTYSSGMYVRLAFSVAIAVEPDVLVVDEALAVGDEGFQRKCFARLKEMQERGMTILFVSHSSGTIVELCDRALLLDHGELLMDAEPKLVVEQYHRLLFAPPEYTDQVRAEIRGLPQEGATAHGQENFTSRIEYPSHGAAISNLRLLDSKGEQTNNLWEGEDYTLTYTLRLAEEFDNLRCGMLFKTTRGIDLGGCAHSLDKAKLKIGSDIKIRFSFTCRLGQGTYFLNCGCFTETAQGVVTLHRIIDALMFKVLPNPEVKKGSTEARGMIDFEIKAEVA